MDTINSRLKVYMYVAAASKFKFDMHKKEQKG